MWVCFTALCVCVCVCTRIVFKTIFEWSSFFIFYKGHTLTYILQQMWGLIGSNQIGINLNCGYVASLISFDSHLTSTVLRLNSVPCAQQISPSSRNLCHITTRRIGKYFSAFNLLTSLPHHHTSEGKKSSTKENYFCIWSSTISQLSI